jgi:hypothetical protein
MKYLLVMTGPTGQVLPAEREDDGLDCLPGGSP